MGASIMREVKIGAELGKGHLNIVKPREVVLTRCAGWGGGLGMGMRQGRRGEDERGRGGEGRRGGG